MTQIPAMMAMASPPQGVDPIAWANFQAQLMAYESRNQQQNLNRSLRQQNQANQADSSLIFALLQDAQGKQDATRASQESRYQDILQLLGLSRKNVLSDVGNFGDSLLDDVNTNRRRREGKTTSDLSRLGFLGSPSMVQSAGIQNDRAYQEDRTRAKDAMLTQRIGAEERTANNIANFMERKTETYPDTGALNMLLQNAGIAGVGGRPPWSVGGGLGAPSGNARYPMPSTPGAYPLGYGPRMPSNGPATAQRVGFRGTPQTGIPRLQAPAAPPPAQYQAPPDPRSELLNKLLGMGADPFQSNANRLVFNGQPLGSSGPAAAGGFQTVTGWQQAPKSVPGSYSFPGIGGSGVDPGLAALLSQLLPGGGSGYAQRLPSTGRPVATPLTPAQRRASAKQNEMLPKIVTPPTYANAPQFAYV